MTGVLTGSHFTLFSTSVVFEHNSPSAFPLCDSRSTFKQFSNLSVVLCKVVENCVEILFFYLSMLGASEKCSLYWNYLHFPATLSSHTQTTPPSVTFWLLLV